MSAKVERRSEEKLLIGEERHIGLTEEYKKRLNQRKLLFIESLRKKTSEEAIEESMKHIEKLFEQPLSESALSLFMKHLTDSSKEIENMDRKVLEDLLRKHVFLWGPSEEETSQ